MKGFWLPIIALQILCSCFLLDTGHSQPQQMHGTMFWSGALGSSTTNLQQSCYLAVDDPLSYLHLPFYLHSRVLQNLPDKKYKSFTYNWETDLWKIVYLQVYYGQDQAVALCSAHQWQQTLQDKGKSYSICSWDVLIDKGITEPPNGPFQKCT